MVMTRFPVAAGALLGVACGDRAPHTRPEPELRPTVETVPAPSPWTSEDACREALAANPPPEARPFARVGTWNVLCQPIQRRQKALPLIFRQSFWQVRGRQQMQQQQPLRR